MIIEQNVPTPVRTWAECQVEIRNNERTIRLLEDGKPIDYSSYASIKVIHESHIMYRWRSAKREMSLKKDSESSKLFSPTKQQTKQGVPNVVQR